MTKKRFKGMKRWLAMFMSGVFTVSGMYVPALAEEASGASILTEEPTEEIVEIEDIVANAPDTGAQAVAGKFTRVAALSENAIAYFSFDDDKAGLSCNQAIATPYNSPTYGDGIVGKAVHLDRGSGNSSTSQWLDVKTSDGKNVLAGHETLTFNVWGKPERAFNSSDGNWMFYASPTTESPVYPNEQYFGIILTSNALEVQRWHNINGRKPSLFDEANYPEWVMLTVVNHTDSMDVYLNGALVKTLDEQPSLAEVLGGEDGCFQIGKANWGGGEYFSGYLDELTVFDKALTAAEVEALYTSYDDSSGENPELSLLASYDMTVSGDGACANGAVIEDKSGNNFDAVIHGNKATRVDGHLYLDNSGSDRMAEGGAYVELPGTIFEGQDFLTASLWLQNDTGEGNYGAFYFGQEQQGSFPTLYCLLNPYGPSGRKYRAVMTSYEDAGAPYNTETKSSEHETDDEWHQYTVVISGHAIQAYYDGVLVSTDSTMRINREARMTVSKFGSNLKSYIGASEYRGDRMYQGGVGEVKIYRGAMDGDGVKQLYDASKDEYQKEPVDPVVDLHATIINAEAENMTVTEGEDVAIPRKAEVTLSDGSKIENAYVNWYEGEEKVDSTGSLPVGEHTLTGKVSYFDNPIVPQKADPYVIYNKDDNNYYFTSSWPAYGDVNHGYDRIALRKSPTLEGLADAEDNVIWTAHTSGAQSKHIWAPELHKINGKWYIYYAANSDDGIWSIRPYVLECTNSSDLLDPQNWVERGRFQKTDGSYTGAFDAFSLDMTTFENKGRSYVIWAYKGEFQGTNDGSLLLMAELDTDEPWKLASEPILLSKPDYDWEKVKETVNEGPAVLKHGNKIYVAYSASATGPEYCVGMLSADADSDLMKKKSWKKSKKPVLSTDDFTDQYGPGHNSFVEDKNGNTIIVYHSRDQKCYDNECEWADSDPLYDPCRNANYAYVRFADDGTPVLNHTDAVETKDINISIKVTVNHRPTDERLAIDLENLSIDNIDEVRGDLTLPVLGEKGSVITWTSSDPQIISDTDKGKVKAGKVTRPAADTDVTLTANLTIGSESVTKNFTAKVKAAPAAKTFEHYLFAYFVGEGKANGEQIYFADSSDGLHWTALNDGTPVISSSMGEKGLRDPFIIRSPEGDKFYMIATDLKIYGNGDWGKAQRSGSKYIMVWESTDLVDWGKQRMMRVAADEAGCTWAPEAFYDDEVGAYMVFWASMVNGVHSIYRCYTRDFYTFTDPEVWIRLYNTDGDQISVIDTSVIAVENSAGEKTYYRLSKDEAGSKAAVDAGDPSTGKFEILEKATSLSGQWTRISSEYLNNTTGVEGGTIFKFNDKIDGKDTWCMLLDNFGAGGYFPSVTTDLGSGNFTKLNASDYSFPENAVMRHGTVIGITDDEYKALEAAIGSSENWEDPNPSKTLKESVVAHLCFDDEAKSLSGNGIVVKKHAAMELTDDAVSGNALKLNSTNKEWFEMVKQNGDALLTGLDEITINYWSKADGSDNVGWTFFAAADDKAPASNNERYLGVLDKSDSVTVERFYNSGTRPNAAKATSLTAGEWRMVTIIATKYKTRLFIDGVEKNVASSSYRLSDIFGTDGVVQIGKANWGGGEYYNGLIDEFTIFDRAINTSEIGQLFRQEVDLYEPNKVEQGQEEPGPNPPGPNPPGPNPPGPNPPGPNPPGPNPPEPVTPKPVVPNPQEELEKAVVSQNAIRDNATATGAGTKAAPYKVEVKQAAGDTVSVVENYVKGKIKKLEIIAKAGVSSNVVTLNAKTKYQLDGKKGTYKILEDSNGGIKKNGRASKSASVSKKGLLNLKAVKGKGSYTVVLEYEKADGSGICRLTVKVENLNFDKSIKKYVLFSVPGEVKNSAGSVVKTVSENLASEELVINVTDISGKPSEMVSGIWSLSAGKGSKVRATMTVAPDGKSVTIKPVAGMKGKANLQVVINKKKYKTSVAILNSTKKKLKASQNTPLTQAAK